MHLVSVNSEISKYELMKIAMNREIDRYGLIEIDKETEGVSSWCNG